MGCLRITSSAKISKDHWKCRKMFIWDTNGRVYQNQKKRKLFTFVLVFRRSCLYWCWVFSLLQKQRKWNRCKLSQTRPIWENTFKGFPNGWMDMNDISKHYYFYFSFPSQVKTQRKGWFIIILGLCTRWKCVESFWRYLGCISLELEIINYSFDSLCVGRNQVSWFGSISPLFWIWIIVTM